MTPARSRSLAEYRLEAGDWRLEVVPFPFFEWPFPLPFERPLAAGVEDDPARSDFELSVFTGPWPLATVPCPSPFASKLTVCPPAFLAAGFA
jgi:hypothetical protein